MTDNWFFADGFNFKDLVQTGYTVSFIVGMILYPLEALMWPLLMIDDRGIDFMLKRIFYYNSMIMYWGVPTATWIGVVIRLVAGITMESQKFEGPFLSLLAGDVGFGLMSLGFSLFFFEGIDVWYTVRVREGKTDEQLITEAKKKAEEESNRPKETETKEAKRRREINKGNARKNFFGTTQFERAIWD